MDRSIDINNPFEGFSSREEFLSYRSGRSTKVDIIEKQRTLIWTRIFLNEEDGTLIPGDKVYIKYNNSGEVLETIFGAYNKKNSIVDDVHDNVRKYEAEDDKKVLCLAVDLDWINDTNNDIPFIRTLFKSSRHYEYNLLKLNELKIYSDKKEFEYYSIDF